MKRFILSCCLLHLCSFFAIAQNQELFLDTSFSQNGYTNYFTQNYADIPSSMKIDHDGKPVIVSYSDDGWWPQLAITRLNTDGSIDLSFSGDGVYVAPSDNSYNTYSQNIIIDDQERIIISGITNGQSYGAFMARFLPDGTPDVSFSDDGIALYTHPSGTLNVGDMATDSNGNFYLFGSRPYSNAADSVDVLKILPDGQVDISFANQGYATMDIGVNSNAQSFEILPDGRFFGTLTIFNQNVSPYIQSTYFVMFNNDGSVDSTFGDNGIMSLENLFPYSEYVYDSFLDESGNVYVAIAHYEIGYEVASILKYNADFNIDTSFGVNGYASHSDFDGDVEFFSIDIQDEKILACGSGTFPGVSKAIVSLFDMQGEPISTFGEQGTLQVSLPNTYPSDQWYRGEFLPDGRIIASGRSSSENGLASIGVFRLFQNPIVIDDVFSHQHSDHSVYPVPAKNHLYISGPLSQKVTSFAIHDSHGRLMKSETIASKSMIPIHDLSSGYYVLRLESDHKEVVCIPFIKQ